MKIKINFFVRFQNVGGKKRIFVLWKKSHDQNLKKQNKTKQNKTKTLSQRNFSKTKTKTKTKQNKTKQNKTKQTNKQKTKQNKTKKQWPNPITFHCWNKTENFTPVDLGAFFPRTPMLIYAN